MCNGGSSSEDLRVENLIEGFKNYGGQPKFLFTVQDLLDKYNIPKVVRCLEEVEKLVRNCHSLIRGVLIQSCSDGANKFTNYVFCHPQFSSSVIQNIENCCAIRAKF